MTNRRIDDVSDVPVREKTVGVSWTVFASVVLPLCSALVLGGTAVGTLNDSARRITKLEDINEHRIQNDQAVASTLSALVARVESLTSQISQLSSHFFVPGTEPPRR